MHIQLTIPPSVNHLYRFFVDRSGRPRVAMSRAGKKWMQDNAWLVKNAINQTRWKKADEKVILDLWVWWKDAGVHDCDNLLKAIQDLLKKNGVVGDDTVFLPRWQDYNIDRRNPRVEVRVWKRADGDLTTVGRSMNGIAPLCVACPPSCPTSRPATPATGPRTALTSQATGC